MEARNERGAGAKELGHYRRLGDYVLFESVAAGWLGETWVGKRERRGALGELRTLKILHRHAADSPALRDPFLLAAKRAAPLEHGGVLRTLEVGRADADVYVAYEHVAGRDLHALILRSRRRQLPTPAPLVAYVGLRVAEALDAASDKGVLHEGLCPHAIVVAWDGRVKVQDFDLRAVASGWIAQSGHEVQLGYRAPEGLMGLGTDARTDQFALGVCLWELLVGLPLFRRGSEVATLDDITRARVPAVRSKIPSCPQELALIVEKMLSREPDQRFAEYGEVRQALSDVIARQDPMPSRQDLAMFLKGLFEDEFKLDKMRLDALELVGQAGGLATPPRGVPAMGEASLFDELDPHEQSTAVFLDAMPLARKLEHQILFERESQPRADASDSASGRGQLQATFRPGRASASQVSRPGREAEPDAMAAFEAPELAAEREAMELDAVGPFSGERHDAAPARAQPDPVPEDEDPFTMADLAALERELRASALNELGPPVGDQLPTRKLSSIPPPAAGETSMLKVAAGIVLTGTLLALWVWWLQQ